MRWCTIMVIALLLGASLPARAQQAECVEFSSPPYSENNIRHRVDLETGAMTTFEYEAPSRVDALLNSLDERYSLESTEPGSTQLVVIDHETETRLVVSENAHAAAWSPDGVWLAYVQAVSRDETHPTLILYNIKTTEHHEHDFEAPIGLWGPLKITWSPDSTQIGLLVIENIDTEYSRISLFSAPDLTLRHVFEVTLFAAEILWSPSSQFLLVFSRVIGELMLIDTRDGHVANTVLAQDVGYYFFWSPTEEFLLAYLTVGDHASQLVVLNQQGEHLIDDVYVPAGQYGLIVAHHWRNDHQLLVNVRDNGLNDLTVIDLQTGERQILHANIGGYALSSDHRTVALMPLDIQNPSTPPNVIHFFDLTRDDETLTIPIRSLMLDESPSQFTWRADRAAMIMFFEDNSLQEYDFETEAWRFIATIPDDERWAMRRVACEG